MDILLIGGGGHCKAVIDVIEASRDWRIAGIVEAAGSDTREVLGYPVVGYDDDLDALVKHCPTALVTVGQIKTPKIRMSLFSRLTDIGFALPAIVSPLARVGKGARIGAGTIVMHFAQIGPDAQVGANVIVNTRALVEHDARVGDHCHISTGSIVNGGTRIGEGTLLGSGAVCREGISIGRRCIVAMGSRAFESVPDDTIYFGEKFR